MTPADVLAHAAAWVERGHELEHRTPADLDGAIACYDRAAALVRETCPSSSEASHALALAGMNRANALQRKATPEACEESAAAYDAAIALLESLPAPTPEQRNSLGAAWMNRGHALLRGGDALRRSDAERAFDRAIAHLQSLPAAASRSFRINHAAAWMNQANARLAAGNCAGAAQAAETACELTRDHEQEDPVMADIGLKARRAACEAAGRQLADPGLPAGEAQELASRAADWVDAALALARRWEAQGVPGFRPMAARLFWFGAELHRLYLPGFLPEFLLEHLDPDQSAGAMGDAAEFRQIAAEALGRLEADLLARRGVFLDTPETARQLTWLDRCREASRRLQQLAERSQPDGSANQPPAASGASPTL